MDEKNQADELTTETIQPCRICNGARTVPETRCVVPFSEPMRVEPTGERRRCPGCAFWEGL
jgi:hypothetical protein